jgi:hypothetical protein
LFVLREQTEYFQKILIEFYPQKNTIFTLFYFILFILYMIEILIITYTHVYFEDPGDRTYSLIKGWSFLGRGITTEKKSEQVTKEVLKVLK